MASLSELVALVGGVLVGDGETVIEDALPIQDATAHCITVVDSAKNAQRFEQCPAAAAVVTEPIQSTKPQIVVESLHGAFRKIVLSFRMETRELDVGVSPHAFVSESAVVGSDVHIGAGATVGENVVVGDGCRVHPGVVLMHGVVLGQGCEIFPNSVLYPESKLGNRVVLHAGCVIGADGFGYFKENGRHHKSSQLGWVEICDDVEVGANTTIDCGTYGPTRIGEGSKLDNLVQIGHNVHLGKHNLICAQVGIAGSASTGEYVVMGGQVGVADHTHLNDGAMVGAQSGVMKEVAAGDVVFGSPAIPRKNKLHEVILTGKLPEMVKELKRLRRVVDELQAKLLDSGSDSAKAA